MIVAYRATQLELSLAIDLARECLFVDRPFMLEEFLHESQ